MQNTFEPCKNHENGHYNWCLLCEIEQLRNENKNLYREIRELRVFQEFARICHKYFEDEITELFTNLPDQIKNGEKGA